MDGLFIIGLWQRITKTTKLTLRTYLIASLLCASLNNCYSQQKDSVLNQVSTIDSSLTKTLPSNYYSKVDKKITGIDDKLTKKSLKYLAKFQRQERKLQQKIQKLNPDSVTNILASADEKYKELSGKIKNKTAGISKVTSGEYIPNLDSLGTSLSFLKQFDGISDKVKGPLSSFDQLQSDLQQSEKIKTFIAERKNQIKELLSKYTHLPAGLKNEYAKLNKTSYYYSTQLKEYREMLRDPDKMEKKALSIMRELPAFQKFMKENSQLANLFGIPANYGNSQSLAGLQTIDQVQQLVAGRIGSGPNASRILQQQVQAAQGELNKFKDKLTRFGSGSADIEMPDFVPNTEKTKTFLQRLEYGSNLQTTRGTYSFPTTTDIGLSVGYKLSNKNTIGIGASYKAGWGKDIQHIRITAEGLGLRSFFEFKLKKTFYATGGLEYNYQQPFKSLQQLENSAAWLQSGLIGISKVVDIKSKVFKKTKLQLLWDFLSYRQTSRTQPLKFRVGYNF